MSVSYYDCIARHAMRRPDFMAAVDLATGRLGWLATTVFRWLSLTPCHARRPARCTSQHWGGCSGKTGHDPAGSGERAFLSGWKACPFVL